ncbi:hypothetical protein yc1106_01462 [Curvularia clavata]|uniref:Uncharacterized protein n=1 Tax=Curvularia clavata TaxID=95742 RepID=A0A9Q8Z4I2_CURCL|nr:hypothetical protein yc1106_01462 [Curvularia clavata]
MERSRTIQSVYDDDTPLITSPEATSYDSGNVAMHPISSSPLYSPPMVTSPEIIETKSGAYAKLNSPPLDVEDGILFPKPREHAHHAKRFDHNEARKTLLKTGAGRLLITLFFSAAMCITLKSWEGFRHPVVLSKIDVRIFNSITIGISLCLGLNLLASLKHYASFFRWSFLARRYVSLEVFDLILHFSSLAKVTKLMVISMPGLRGRKWLRRFRWFKDVRDDGTKWMWLACLVWLCINIGSQILVALLSLFWPMNNSAIPLFLPGNVSVANLNAWHIDENPPEDDINSLVNQTSLEAAWTFGTEAMAYPVFNLSNIQLDLSGLAGTPIYAENGAYHYRFFNRDPARPYTNYLSSSRNVTARATCERLEVGDNGTVFDPDDGPLYVNARRHDEQNWTQYTIPEAAGGSVTWTAAVPMYCGPRCTNFTVLQNKGDRVTETSLFLCNSTLGPISSVAAAANDITVHSAADAAAVYGTDTFARIAAGAMGWTGIPWNSWLDRQSRSYSQGSKWSPPSNMNASAVEDLLMRFTIGAVAAFDDHGIKYNVSRQNVVPSQGQQLDVDWPYVLGILGGICLIQLLALCLLVLFANRTIVRDDSYFSMAMLLRPVVMKIGEGEGLNMSGEEIKEHRALRWRRIRYDYIEGSEGRPNQVTISWEGRDKRESRGSWAAGRYS